MKKIYSIFLIFLAVLSVNAQNLLTNGSFETWTDGLPDGWLGSKSNITLENVLESTDAQDGSKSVELLNATDSHKRFTSQPLNLLPETTYTLTFYAKGTGEIRNAFFNGNPDSSGSGYSSYSSYTTVGSEWSEIEFVFTTDAENYQGVEVIFSLRNTSEDTGVVIDNAVLTAGGVIEIVEVANISELRGGETDGTIYELTGEAILTFQQTYRNQKYIQDQTSAILIDDQSGIITGEFEIGDGITGITGTLTTYGGILQFVPTEEVASVTSTGNEVIPETVSLTDYLTNPTEYESELIQINQITITDIEEGDGTFQTGQNYTLTSGSETVIGRTQFYDIELIGQTLPEEPFLAIGFGGRYNETIQLFLLDVADLLGVIDPTSSNVSMTTVWNNNATFITKGETSVEIYELNGQLVQKAKGTNNFSVNVSGLTKGVYVVKITVDGEVSTQRVVKK